MPTTLEASLWAATIAQQTPLPDQRLADRLEKILHCWADRPQDSIPQAADSWGQAKACYRFLENPRVTAEALIEGIGRATAAAAGGRAVLYMVQDTTTLNFTGLQQTKDLGPVNDAAQARGLHLHTVLALSPQGLCLGVLDQQSWTRPPRTPAPADPRRPFEEKESAKWVNGMEAARRRLYEALGTPPRLVHVMDREGDIYEVLQAIDDAGESGIIRAAQDRCLDAAPGRAYAAVRAQPVLACTPLPLPAAPGRSARTAVVELRCLPATLVPDRDKHPYGWPVAWTLVEVWEPDPPQGVAGLHWRLWTREPATTPAEVLGVLRGYTWRWPVETYHFTLKSGCRIEQLQLETAERLRKAVALYSAVAARVLGLREGARQEPEAPATVLLREEEWQVLWLYRHQRPWQAGTAPPTLREAALWIGRLGGHLNRKGDGMPGVKTLWRGLRELERLVEGYRLARLAHAEGCG